MISPSLSSRFECLPNELIVQIFDYLDIRDVFNGFHQLNDRFDQLLRPFENLRLILSEKSSARFEHLLSYIDTLIIEDELPIHWPSLQSIRHLMIYCSCDKILTNINSKHVPFLEYFSISHALLIKLDVYRKFFSQEFLQLKFCNLCGSIPVQARQSKLLFRCWKMGGIDWETYQCVLATCPNLIYLKFRMLKSQSMETINRSRLHRNLKQLIIDVEISGWPQNDQLIERCLELVPNVELLNIYTSNFISKIQESIIEYDWLASIIVKRLVFLQQFFFFFRLKWSTVSNELKDRTILQQLEKNFTYVHCQKYQARFVIKIE